ncbi:autotransporter domain-containing protein [Hyphomicrobium sp. D-2]|uniref:autotransporter domain-containing protein n=1 Tax=Hyphomicrobium sp. D-2 TaxID=3041621 RepID=UPI002454B686|nr:autotransporter domain-containing protein [Hyphomicrobium sp. D-2]MDH4981869.1 autotransporter domain-containing protein [Hyphomicrobium sp. D-2]
MRSALQRRIFSMCSSALAITAILSVSPDGHAADVVINGTTENSPPFSMNPSDDLLVGTTGTGALNVISGTFQVNSAVLGTSASGNGTVTVSAGGAFGGPGANFTIGDAGIGTFSSIDDTTGSYNYSALTILGAQAGSTGTATLSGSRAEWNITSSFTIGGAGTGTLTVSNGATLNTLPAANVIIGDAATGVGTATIDNVSWSAFSMRVGNLGSGTVTVENGADLAVGNGGLTVASNTGSTGLLNVTGTGSSVSSSGATVIGQSGNGTFNLSAGATATFTGSFSIGTTATGVGIVNFTGPGTAVTATSVISGTRGDGTLNILDGATLTSTTAGVGAAPGGTGKGVATVSGVGSTWTNTGADFQVGFGPSTGTLNIENGGSVVTSQAMTLGWNTLAAPGTVNVSGTDSTLDVGGDLTVGRAGTGIMNVTDGAFVDSGTVYIGSQTGGVGTLNISGASTVWDASSTFYAGYGGTGTLNITGGMKFDATNYMGYLYLGYDGGGNGTVNISGAGTQVVVDNYIEWHSGTGALNITDSASVTTDYLYGGGGDGGSTMLVSGAGTHFNADYGAYIGYYGALDVTVTDSALFSASFATLNIGVYSGADGSVTVSNGAQATAPNIAIGRDAGSTGVLTLATGGSATTPGTVQLAQDAGSTGTLIFGAKAGDPAVAAGTLSAPTVAFGAGNGAIVFNHTGSMNFSPVISGGGSANSEINVLAGNTNFTANNNAFGGTMNVTGGTAYINGNMGNTQAIVSGTGTLGGSDWIGALEVQSGGTVAPGNSIGTLTVAGDGVFEVGSKFAVEVNGAQSDLLYGNGYMTLNGGTVLVSGVPSLLKYAILTADFGVTGTFEGVETTSAFVLYSLDYDFNNVYLLIDGYKSLTSAAGTPNEIAVAKALDQFPKDNPLFSAVVGGSIADAQQAFNALSGEIHASVGSALADDSRYVREAITGRLIQSYYGGAGAGGGQPIVLAAAAPTNVATIDTSSRMSLGAGYDGAQRVAPGAGRDVAFWSRAFGAWGQYDSNNNAATTDRNLGGFVLGADGDVGGGWRAGLATGYLNTSLSTGAGRFSSADIDSYVLGGYAGGGIGDFAFRSGGTWTWNSIDTSRTVAFPGFIEGESASYDGDVGQLFAELAYPVFVHGGVIEPFAGLAYVHVGTGGFTESGPVAGLTSSRQSMDLGYGTLGARAGTTMVWGGTTVIPHASLAWQYAFGDVTPVQALAFASTGIGMGIGGVPVAQNSALFEVGADAILAEDMTLGLSYMGQYSGDFTDNGLRGHFNWKF